MLDISPLDGAIAQLEKALAFADSDLARRDPETALQFRASSIHAFEYTYELAVKMLRRHLVATEASTDIEGLSFNHLIRLGYKRALLDEELRVWQGFRENRNRTSHTYDEAKAEDVFRAIPPFLAEARTLAARLRNRAAGGA